MYSMLTPPSSSGSSENSSSEDVSVTSEPESPFANIFPDTHIAQTLTSHITIKQVSRTSFDLIQTMNYSCHPLQFILPQFLAYGPREYPLYYELLSNPKWTPFQLLAILYNTGPPERVNIGNPALVVDGARIIGIARSIPFHWPTPDDNSSLPDEGWSAILGMGSSPHEAPGPPNTLGVLSVTIDPVYRAINLGGPDIGSLLISALTVLAKKCGLRAMVESVRPFRKSLGGNVWVPMEKYFRCRWNEDPTTKIHENAPESPTQFYPITLSGDNMLINGHYEPYISKCLKRGAKIVKVCPRSIIVEAGCDDWEAWTCVDFSKPIVNPFLQGQQHDGTSEPTASAVNANSFNGQGGNTVGLADGEKKNEKYYEVLVPGGVVPVKVFPHKAYIDRKSGGVEYGIGLYVEPNIWVRHY